MVTVTPLLFTLHPQRKNSKGLTINMNRYHSYQPLPLGTTVTFGMLSMDATLYTEQPTLQEAKR